MIHRNDFLVHTIRVSIKGIGIWIIQVLPASAAIAFGLSKWSRDRFEINAKKLEFLAPHYEELQKHLGQSQQFFGMSKENLIRVIGSTRSPRSDGWPTLPDFLLREPYHTEMLNFSISGHLPSKCQKMVRELFPIFEASVNLLNETTNYYRENSSFQDIFLLQHEKLDAAQKLINDKIKEIRHFIDQDKLDLTKSIRRRNWIAG